MDIDDVIGIVVQIEWHLYLLHLQRAAYLRRDARISCRDKTTKK
jgi:hypothetical protein